MPRRIVQERVRKQLKAPAKRALAGRLPWPYCGMVADITSAIQTCCNYLVASGLVCYTEVCGRQLLYGGDRKVANHKCFAAFLRYMGTDAVLEQPVLFRGRSTQFYNLVRHGLVHEYFMKSESGGVAMISSSVAANQTGFLVRNNNEVWLVAVPSTVCATCSVILVPIEESWSSSD